MKVFWLVIEWPIKTNWSYETPEPWARLLPCRSAPTFLRGDRRVFSKYATSFSWWKVFPTWIPTLLLWTRAAACQGGLSTSPRFWSQFCQDRLLFLPGILNMRENYINHFCFRQLWTPPPPANQVWWHGQSPVFSASPCSGPASVFPSVWTAWRMWNTLVPIANLPLVATRVVSRVWISSNYVCQKLSCCNLQPTTRTSTRAV